VDNTYQIWFTSRIRSNSYNGVQADANQRYEYVILPFPDLCKEAGYSADLQFAVESSDHHALSSRPLLMVLPK
jgi:hypothetical protein